MWLTRSADKVVDVGGGMGSLSRVSSLFGTLAGLFR
jgi:hypothetical protein